MTQFFSNVYISKVRIFLRGGKKYDIVNEKKRENFFSYNKKKVKEIKRNFTIYIKTNKKKGKQAKNNKKTKNKL